MHQERHYTPFNLIPIRDNSITSLTLEGGFVHVVGARGKNEQELAKKKNQYTSTNCCFRHPFNGILVLSDVHDWHSRNLHVIEYVSKYISTHLS